MTAEKLKPITTYEHFELVVMDAAAFYGIHGDGYRIRGIWDAVHKDDTRIKELEGLLRTSLSLHEGYCEAGCAECEQGKEKADCHIGSHLHDIMAALGEESK